MSFKVGDIVTPRPPNIGNGYNFRIAAEVASGNPFERKFELERVENIFNPIYGPFEYQNNTLNQAEHILWDETELDDAYKYNPRPYIHGKPDDAVDSLNYATQVMGNSEISYDNSIKDMVFDEFNYIKINMEENIMNILDLYKERKEKEIEKEYKEKRQEIMEQDTIQSIIIEMQDQVNAILESEDLKGRLKVYEENLHTRETEEKLNKLRTETDKKEQELRSTLDEIRALFEMTGDYAERIKILKNYKILNKDGKLSV